MPSEICARGDGIRMVTLGVACADAEVAAPASPSAVPTVEDPRAITNPFYRAPSVVVEVTPSASSEAQLSEPRPADFRVIGASEAQMNRATTKMMRPQLAVGDCAYADRTVSAVQDAFSVVACKGPWEYFVVGKVTLPNVPFASPETGAGGSQSLPSDGRQ